MCWIPKKGKHQDFITGSLEKDNETFNRSEYVALSNALQLYYTPAPEGEKEVFKCFDTFYEFLQTDFVEVLKRDEVKEKDFDVSNFYMYSGHTIKVANLITC